MPATLVKLMFPLTTTACQGTLPLAPVLTNCSKPELAIGDGLAQAVDVGALEADVFVYDVGKLGMEDRFAVTLEVGRVLSGSDEFVVVMFTGTEVLVGDGAVVVGRLLLSDVDDADVVLLENNELLVDVELSTEVVFVGIAVTVELSTEVVFVGAAVDVKLSEEVLLVG